MLIELIARVNLIDGIKLNNELNTPIEHIDPKNLHKYFSVLVGIEEMFGFLIITKANKQPHIINKHNLNTRFGNLFVFDSNHEKIIPNTKKAE